jgi:hypothetical protein
MRKLALQTFDSFVSQRQAEVKFYRSLGAAERLQIFFRIQEIAYGPEEDWPSLRKSPAIRIRRADLRR